MTNVNFDKCYAGIGPDGKVILQPHFELSLRRFYSSQGWEFQPIADRGRAMDEDAEDDLPLLPNSGERNYPELTAAYEKRLRGKDRTETEYEKVNGDFEGRSETTRQLGNEFRLKMVRTPEQIEKEFAEFRRSRGWDAEDPHARSCFELDLYYRDRLNGERS